METTIKNFAFSKLKSKRRSDGIVKWELYPTARLCPAGNMQDVVSAVLGHNGH